MPALAVVALTLLAAYLVGAIPFGYLIARWRGVDIIRQGSGNIGATNVGRVLGRRFGILVFLFDFAKGAIPAAAASWLADLADWTPSTESWKHALPVGAGLAAFLGHLFPVYLHFRGGKGVATGAGVVAVLFPAPAAGALLTWIMVVSASRYVSLASLLAGMVLCVLRLLLTPEPFSSDNRILTLFCFVAVSLIFTRHRANIVRLLHGNENRLRDTPAMFLLGKTLHLLALGLWFGSSVFFTFVVALVIFHAFEDLGAAPPAERPAWLPLADNFDKEKGTRLAGVAVAPIFPWFFLIQGVCGLVAVGTALSWSWYESGSTIHKVRSLVLVLALATVVAGWPLVQKVSALRIARYAADPDIARLAREAFAGWHLASMLLNLVTLVLVAVAMALAARLPTEQKASLREDRSSSATNPQAVARHS